MPARIFRVTTSDSCNALKILPIFPSSSLEVPVSIPQFDISLRCLAYGTDWTRQPGCLSKETTDRGTCRIHRATTILHVTKPTICNAKFAVRIVTWPGEDSILRAEPHSLRVGKPIEERRRLFEFCARYEESRRASGAALITAIAGCKLHFSAETLASGKKILPTREVGSRSRVARCL